MSAPPLAASSVTTAGYADGLGRRTLRFDREVGGTLEVLVLRPELSLFDAPLRARMSELSQLDDERVARCRAIERADGGLTVISEFIAGDRLADLLEIASERVRLEGSAPGIDATLGFLLELLSALSALHAANVVHGCIAPERIVITPATQVVLVDAIYAPSLERLRLTRQRLWNDFGLAMPATAGTPRFDATADLAQAALCGLALLLGRPFRMLHVPEGLSALVEEATEVARIRGNEALASGLQQFFQRALPFPHRSAYASVDAAESQLRTLAEREMSAEFCFAALAEFTQLIQSWTPPEVPELPAAAPVLERASDIDVPFTARYEDSPRPSLAPAFELPEEPIAPAETAPFIAAVPEPQPEPEPVQAWQPDPEPVQAWQPEPEPVRAWEPDPEPVRTWEPEPAPIAAEPVFVAAPVVEPDPVPVQRYEAPTPIEVAPVAPPEQVVVEPAAEPFVPAARFEPTPVPPPRFEPQPQRFEPPPPPFEPVPQQSWTPTPQPRTAFDLDPVDAPRQSEPLKIATVKLKAQEPTRARRAPEPPREFESSPVPFHGTLGSQQEERRPFPWKLAAAAVIVLAAASAVIGRSYLPDHIPPPPTVTLERSLEKPAVTAPSTTAGTISIETQPTGVRVKLDGKEMGETGEAPLRLEDIPPGRHVVMLTSGSVIVNRTVTVAAGKVAKLDVAVYSGWVSVFAPITLNITENGHSLGTTESGRLMLSPGKHTLTFSNKEFGYSHPETVTVDPGEERSLNLEPKGSVNVNATPWAEVWVDGQKAGDTPLANLQVALGTREFVFKHPQYGERRVTTTVTASTPATVSVDFTKPAGQQ
jgi:hypothetical protein